MIRHTVVFRLKHPANSPQEKSFLEIAQKLSSISSVKKFECLREVSPKNDFSFGLSMEFDNHIDYQFYCDHPEHLKFVQDTWIPNVEKFLEIDYQAYS
jgi:hypothetical protein